MKVSGNNLKAGMIISHKGSDWKVISTQAVKPGKGGAFAQVELKNLRNGSKLNERFRSADKVEKVRLEQKEQQFLYESDNSLFFMDQITFEQIDLPTEIISDLRPFLVEGMIVQIEYFEDEPLSITLPDKVICKVKETEPTVKGQTAASSYKPAQLENGLRVMVPPFIQVGEKIIINTNDLSYVKRSE